jgi:hypothetical protein
MTSQCNEAMAYAITTDDLANSADAQVPATVWPKAIAQACPR